MVRVAILAGRDYPEFSIRQTPMPSFGPGVVQNKMDFAMVVAEEYPMGVIRKHCTQGQSLNAQEIAEQAKPRNRCWLSDHVCFVGKYHLNDRHYDGF